MRVTGKAEVVSLYGAYHGLGLATERLGPARPARVDAGGAALADLPPGPARRLLPVSARARAKPNWRRRLGEALEATIAEARDEPGRGADHRARPGPRRPRRLPPEWFDGGPGDLPAPRGATDRRRGADGARPLRRDVRLRPLRARARHPRARQGARRRAAVRGDDGALGPRCRPRSRASPGSRSRSRTSRSARPRRSRCSRSSSASGWPERARELGARATERLEPLRERYECIGDIRGPGLFIGIDLVVDRETREPATEACARAFDHALEIGLLTWFGGAGGNVLKLKPPLTIADDDFDEMLTGSRP